MKKARFTQDQIIGLLKEHQAGATATDLYDQHGISDATFYTCGRNTAGWRCCWKRGGSRLLKRERDLGLAAEAVSAMALYRTGKAAAEQVRRELQRPVP